MTVTEPRLDEPDTGGDDDLDHVTCCVDNDLALCGRDMTDAPGVDVLNIEALCVVCLDLVDGPYCPKRGPHGCVDAL